MKEAGYFKIGDTIVVKYATITKESFDFWRSAETQASSNGNPFGSPAPLKVILKVQLVSGKVFLILLIPLWLNEMMYIILILQKYPILHPEIKD